VHLNVNILVEINPVFDSVDGASRLLFLVLLHDRVEAYRLHVIEIFTREFFNSRLLRIIPALVARTRTHHRSDAPFSGRGLDVGRRIVILDGAELVNVDVSLSCRIHRHIFSLCDLCFYFDLNDGLVHPLPQVFEYQPNQCGGETDSSDNRKRHYHRSSPNNVVICLPLLSLSSS